MGHVRLGALPRTRKWREVILLIELGARATQVANATINAADRGLDYAADDPALIEAVWLATQLPLDARQPNFADALRHTGLDVSDEPSLFEISAAATECVDAIMEKKSHRTDLGEMAQMALAETLNKVVAERAYGGLFGTTHEDIQREFSRLAAPGQFASFCRAFFARLTEKSLHYYVGRASNQQVGVGRRFTTLAQEADFTAALGKHCYEAAKIVERFAGEWLSKTNWEKGGISKQEAAGFAKVAMKKIRDELREGARPDAQ